MQHTYRVELLQVGTLPLRPDRTIARSVAHACTVTLVWPAREQPEAANTVIVDPSFSPAGWAEAQGRLQELGVALDGIGPCFITHPHGDHLPRLPRLPADVPMPRWRLWRPDPARFPGLAAIHCPGHDPGLQALRVPTDGGTTWIVGDAILDEAWLTAWGYYWPNMYNTEAVMATWRSVAVILAGAQTVIPGHGPAIDVSEALLATLLEGFPRAEGADRCPGVAQALQARLAALRGPRAGA